jgi:N-acetylmuramoyl-L-alanine amidase
MTIRIRQPGMYSTGIGALPVWMDSASLSSDSSLLTLHASSLVTAVDWALSQDRTRFLVFLRAGSALEFPEPSWAGPPSEPEIHAPAWEDSAVASILQGGGRSPWLADFDCVVLDPGHGGRDPGAVGPSGTFEKDRTLEIALLARDLMAIQTPGLRVVLTRTDDRYVSLGARTRLANSEQADLFISIHCNAATRRDAAGFETFFLSLARTDDARAVAALENGVTVLDDPADSAATPDALSFLLADIAQNLFLTQSSAFASIVQQNLARMREDGLDRGVKQAGFYVLRGAYMPSVLVETAFISNPGEEALLASLDFRFEAARAIVSAVEEFAMGRGMEW